MLASLFCVAGCVGDAGPPIAAIVEGDSMAPAVCGQHLAVSCDECQHQFDSELVREQDKVLTCPNCGYGDLKTDNAKLVPAAPVELLPYARPPRRWDVVGFNLPDDADAKTGVKRIVGLPGDEIEIRDGDLWRAGNMLRKKWDLQKQVRIRVFDSSCNAVIPFDNRSRFRPFSPETGWSVRKDSFRFMSVKDGRTDWFDYFQWRNCKRQGSRDDDFPIEDNYGYNQSIVRELNQVDDIFLELDAEFEIGAKIKLAFKRDQAEFVFEIERTETEYRTSWQGSTQRKPLVLTPVVESDLPQARIEFSSFDRTLNLRIDGTSVFELREDESANDVAKNSVFDPGIKVPFRIGGSAGMFRINRIRIWRDIYYLKSPSGFAAAENVKLVAGPDEYLVLGDNSPQSLDSRTWKKPGISRDDIIGKLELE